MKYEHLDALLVGRKRHKAAIRRNVVATRSREHPSWLSLVVNKVEVLRYHGPEVLCVLSPPHYSALSALAIAPGWDMVLHRFMLRCASRPPLEFPIKVFRTYVSFGVSGWGFPEWFQDARAPMPKEHLDILMGMPGSTFARGVARAFLGIPPKQPIATLDEWRALFAEAGYPNVLAPKYTAMELEDLRMLPAAKLSRLIPHDPRFVPLGRYSAIPMTRDMAYNYPDGEDAAFIIHPDAYQIVANFYAQWPSYNLYQFTPAPIQPTPQQPEPLNPITHTPVYPGALLVSGDEFWFGGRWHPTNFTGRKLEPGKNGPKIYRRAKAPEPGKEVA